MRIPIRPSSVAETNAILRALWASMRAEFGAFSWQFAPLKRGERKTIYFGWTNLGLNQSVRIGVTYERRGIATGLLFENADEVGTRIRGCVATALEASPAEFAYFVSLGMSLKIDMASAAGKLIQLNPLDKGRVQLGLGVRGYDSTDANAELQRRTRLIVDALSFMTNVTFEILMIEENSEKTVEEIPRKPDSMHDVGWIDGHPIRSNLLVVDEQGLSFLDALLADELSEQVATLADAAHHFHSGLATELRDHELDPVGVNTEQAIVLYLSALEVASIIDAPDSKPCETCGQTQYKIAARVKDFVMHFMGNPAAECVKSLYGSRSTYLHRGLLLSSRSYGGVTLPQLDPLSSNGVRAQLPVAPVLNLREFTSFCLRSAVKQFVEGASS